MQFAVRTLAPDMRIASVVVDAPDEADERVEEVFEDERLEADVLEEDLRHFEFRDGLCDGEV